MTAVLMVLLLLLSACSRESSCDTICDGLSQLATARMKWKHCARAGQFLWLGELPLHPVSPNFSIAQWFWLPGMEETTKKGSHLFGVVSISIFALAASRSNGQSGPLRVRPFYHPQGLCRLLLPQALGNRLRWEMGLGLRVAKEVFLRQSSERC